MQCVCAREDGKLKWWATLSNTKLGWGERGAGGKQEFGKDNGKHGQKCCTKSVQDVLHKDISRRYIYFESLDHLNVFTKKISVLFLIHNFFSYLLITDMSVNISLRKCYCICLLDYLYSQFQQLKFFSDSSWYSSIHSEFTA